MAFASTPYIKAGIDLFFSFTNKECLNAILIMIRYNIKLQKVNKTLTNNRVFKIVSALENSQNQY
jgi:hypothetical protein